jgi:hypothetical protein
MTLRVKAIGYVETSATTHPSIQHHIQEELNNKKRRCEKLKCRHQLFYGRQDVNSATRTSVSGGRERQREREREKRNGRC